MTRLSRCITRVWKEDSKSEEWMDEMSAIFFYVYFFTLFPTPDRRPNPAAGKNPVCAWNCS